MTDEKKTPKDNFLLLKASKSLALAEKSDYSLLEQYYNALKDMISDKEMQFGLRKTDEEYDEEEYNEYYDEDPDTNGFGPRSLRGTIKFTIPKTSGMNYCLLSSKTFYQYFFKQCGGKIFVSQNETHFVVRIEYDVNLAHATEVK